LLKQHLPEPYSEIHGKEQRLLLLILVFKIERNSINFL